MGFNDVEDALPHLGEGVPNFFWSLVDRESALAGNPERWVGGNAGTREDLFHVAVNQIRVEAVGIIRGAEPASSSTRSVHAR